MPDTASVPPPADDDLDRALRDLIEGRAGEARFREPSAAERAMAAKKQSELARKQARARARHARKRPRRRRGYQRAEGWRGGVRYDVPARRKGGKGRAAAAVMVPLVLAGAALLGWRELARSAWRGRGLRARRKLARAWPRARRPGHAGDLDRRAKIVTR